MKLNPIVVGLCFLVSSSSAFASGAYLEISGGPKYTLSNPAILGTGGAMDGQEVKNREGLGYEAYGTFGYAMWDKFLIGFTYYHLVLPEKQEGTATSGSVDQNLTRDQYGPTLGLLAGGFRLTFTGLVGGKRTITYKTVDPVDVGGTISDTKWEDKVGLGYQITAGYAFHLGPRVLLGPSLVYRRVNYKTQTKTQTITPDPGYTPETYTDKAYSTRPIEGSLTPMLTFVFKL